MQGNKRCHYCGCKPKTNFHCKSCPKFCFLCYRYGATFPCSTGISVTCSSCHIKFPNDSCYSAHLSTNNGRRKSLCNQRIRCLFCDCLYFKRGENPHYCDTLSSAVCSKCKTTHDDKQLCCYIQKIKIPSKYFINLILI